MATTRERKRKAEVADNKSDSNSMVGVRITQLGVIYCCNMLVAAVLDAEGSPKFIASLIAALVKSRAKSGTIVNLCRIRFVGTFIYA